MNRSPRLLLAAVLVAFAGAPCVASAASETIHVVTIQPASPQAHAALTLTLLPVVLADSKVAEDAMLGREIPGLPPAGGDSPAWVVGDTAHFHKTASGFKYEGGYKRRGVGEVTVMDQNEAPVPGTRVYYAWSGCSTETGSALTDVNGLALFYTTKAPACGRGGASCCNFVLDGISLTPPPPVAYDAAQNHSTHYSAKCNPVQCP